MTIEYRGEKFAGYNKPKRTPSPPKKVARSPRKGRRHGKTHPFRTAGRIWLTSTNRRISVGQGQKGII
jgi:hypothetical protein